MFMSCFCHKNKRGVFAIAVFFCIKRTKKFFFVVTQSELLRWKDYYFADAKDNDECDDEEQLFKIFCEH